MAVREVTLNNVLGTGGYIVSEAMDAYLSREVGVIAQGFVLNPGTVLARYTSGPNLNKFGPYDPAATDGRQGGTLSILYEKADTTDKAVKKTMTVRHTQVQRSLISFAAAAPLNDSQKAAAYALLAINQVVMR